MRPNLSIRTHVKKPNIRRLPTRVLTQQVQRDRACKCNISATIRLRPCIRTYCTLPREICQTILTVSLCANAGLSNIVDEPRPAFTTKQTTVIASTQKRSSYFTVIYDRHYTNSISASSAPSPRRGPSFNTRV